MRTQRYPVGVLFPVILRKKLVYFLFENNVQISKMPFKLTGNTSSLILASQKGISWFPSICSVMNFIPFCAIGFEERLLLLVS